MLFAIKIMDRPDSAHLRDSLREPHLAYLAGYHDEMIFDGPFLTNDGAQELGSFRILELPDRKAAQRHIENEPFVTGGLQYGEEIYRYQAYVPHTYADCPRTEGNLQFFAIALDNPSRREKRLKLATDHLRYYQNNAGHIMTVGELVSDDGIQPVGTLAMIDAPDAETALGLFKNDPLTAAGVFETVAFHRWRFGRTFDRLKPAS